MSPNASNLKIAGQRRLLKELEMIKEEKDLGINVQLAKDPNGNDLLDEWDIYIIGPPETLYENYLLHAKMNFPPTYPFLPPTFKFITPMFHPNIYNDGMVCISILHTDRDDPTDTESVNYTWTPGQNVRTICLSIISLLNAPNIFSPANVDASKMLRDDSKLYEETVKQLLAKSGTKASNQNKTEDL